MDSRSYLFSAMRDSWVLAEIFTMLHFLGPGPRVGIIPPEPGKRFRLILKGVVLAPNWVLKYPHLTRYGFQLFIIWRETPTFPPWPWI